MVCPHCGRRTFRGETICPKCGAKMPPKKNMTEGESFIMNEMFNLNENAIPMPGENAAPVQPAKSPLPEEPTDEVFVPALEFPMEPKDAVSSADDDLSSSFYGSYGDVADNVPMTMPQTSETDVVVQEPVIAMPSPVLLPDDGFEDLELPDDLPPIPAPVADNTVKKSMGYETTVKLANARRADKNEKPLNEPIKTERPTYTPKPREFDGIASGTAHVSGGLPELRDDQMYVALTHKELRRLKSRRFRGLGVVATLCLAIIASFCIWSYAHSFADPLVGRWNGNVDSANLPIEAIQSMSAGKVDSTWEFGSSGSLYVNLVINETPISLNGSYTEMKDENGEQYLSMELNNPMDSNAYTFNMYYTVTGTVLQFNDMEGMGMEIDLTKE